MSWPRFVTYVVALDHRRTGVELTADGRCQEEQCGGERFLGSAPDSYCWRSAVQLTCAHAQVFQE